MKDTQATLIDDMMSQVLGRKGANAPAVPPPVLVVSTPPPKRTIEEQRAAIAATPPQQFLVDAIDDQLAVIDNALAAIRQNLAMIANLPEAPASPPETPLPAPEAPVATPASAPTSDEAQRAFDEGLAAKKAAALASLDADTLQKAAAAVAVASSGEWKCPEHGVAQVNTNSRTGKRYRVCPTCGDVPREQVI